MLGSKLPRSLVIFITVILLTLIFFLNLQPGSPVENVQRPSTQTTCSTVQPEQQQARPSHIELEARPEPEFCNYCSPTDELCKRYGSFNLARSRAYEGPNVQLKRVLRKARSKQPIKIGILGGSVSLGVGVTQSTNWATLYAEYLRETYGVEVELINGSIGATTSEYMETCLLEHIPEDVDLVIVELAINDRRFEHLAVGYENLIRAIFALPNKPAIINLQIMALMFDSITMGGDLHTAIAQYYDTPIVSVRNVLLPQILKTTEIDPNDTSLEDYWYYHSPQGLDLRHLGTNGHRIITDLLKSFTSRVACEGWREEFSASQHDPTTPRTLDWTPSPNEGLINVQDVAEYLPRQSLFQKYDHTTVMKPAKPFCQTAAGKKNPLQPLPPPFSSEGDDAFKPWSYPTRPDKVWLTGRKPGVRVAFAITASTLGRIRVTFLRSKTYGLGSAFCWIDEDKERGVRMDGWWNIDHIHSQHTVVVTDSIEPGDHTLYCEILEETRDPGGGTEFRIIAIDAL